MRRRIYCVMNDSMSLRLLIELDISVPHNFQMITGVFLGKPRNMRRNNTKGV